MSLQCGLFHTAQIKTGIDSSWALCLTHPCGFMGSHRWLLFMEAKMGGGGERLLGMRGRRSAARGEIIWPIIPRIPSFYDKIKLQDLIKLCDVFVKLKKKMVFDVWWKEIEISNDSVILESLPGAQLSSRELLVVIKAVELIQSFDWATLDIAGTFNLLVWSDNGFWIKSSCRW